jgi:peptidoglycan hydrolase-like protein with peptidoglycan-binding domain
MSTVLAQMPGQTVTIIQQILNADGYRQDGYIVPGYSGPNGEPVISRILQPGFVPATGFPATMTQLDTGLYTYNFVLPSGASAVGIYVVDLFWYNPTTLSLQQDVVLINVTAPFGVYTATVSGG